MVQDQTGALCSFDPVPSLTPADPSVPLPLTAEVSSGLTGFQEKVDEVFLFTSVVPDLLGSGDPLAWSGGVSASGSHTVSNLFPVIPNKTPGRWRKHPERV